MKKRERPGEAKRQREYLNFFENYLDTTYDLLSLEEQAAALYALLEYMFYGIVPEDLSGGAAILFKMAKPAVDNSIRKQETARKNGQSPKSKAKRSKATTKQNEATAKQNEATTEQNGNEERKKKEEERKKKLEKEWGSEARAGAQGLTHTPIVEEWLSYLAEKHKNLTERQKQVIESQIASNIQRYGEQAVKNLVRAMIGAGYTEIYFDRLERRETKSELRGFDALVEMERREVAL